MTLTLQSTLSAATTRSTVVAKLLVRLFPYIFVFSSCLSFDLLGIPRRRRKSKAMHCGFVSRAHLGRWCLSGQTSLITIRL
ncbi:hypothetical protein SCLCIDRAFT_1213789 [Scleroderma citrinum Foug A]|uniref:Uncharacterized protein n=1 Tax=Scleroderma citrinum Foug A TaxID=1036808 RepID=A0A0C2ZQX2_9AGAM|nr:hypothetical protein SCLCIDRAFT_1213789 [Scleroderma citrinum Foug A]